MVDADTEPPRSKDLINRFLKIDAPVVSGVVHGVRGAERFPSVYKFTDGGWEVDWGYGEEVEAVGGACLLVRREVFEEMDFPWFVTSPERFSEDYYFCKKYGKPIRVMKELICTHWKEIGI